MWSLNFSDRPLHRNLVKSTLRKWWSRFPKDLPPVWKFSFNYIVGQVSKILWAHGTYYRPPDEDGNADCEILKDIIGCENTNPPYVDRVNITLEGERRSKFFEVFINRFTEQSWKSEEEQQVLILPWYVWRTWPKIFQLCWNMILLTNVYGFKVNAYYPPKNTLRKPSQLHTKVRMIKKFLPHRYKNEKHKSEVLYKWKRKHIRKIIK